ncbi:MAG: M48 family metalloprotease [Acidobacteria bacterium]|nr:M48 family metalloprotease [Acidobacteriota bacterium]
MTALVSSVTDFLLTWVVHATIISAVALAAGRWAIRAPRVRDYVWKGALVAPVVTSLVATLVSDDGFTGVLHLPALLRSAFPLVIPPVSATLAVSAEGQQHVVAAQMHEPLAVIIRCIVGAGILLPALLATARLLRRRRQFGNLLATRRPISNATLGISGDALHSRTAGPLRVTACESIGSAVALGRREVCVSLDAFNGLAVEERRSILAHEVAHLERRDPAWMATAQALASLLVVTPLVAMVADRMQRDAELICDDAAVMRVGAPLAHVRALTAFALALDPAAQCGSTFASADSRIVQRAQRVLRRDAERRQRWSGSFVAACVGIAAVAAGGLLPRVSAASGPVTVSSGVQSSSANASARVISVTVKPR